MTFEEWKKKMYTYEDEFGNLANDLMECIDMVDKLDDDVDATEAQVVIMTTITKVVKALENMGQ